jgi:hypothetical protein
MSFALLLPLLIVGVKSACSEVAAVQSSVGTMNLLEGTVPWLCVPPEGELKLAKLDLSLSSGGSLPFQAQYREKKDVEPTIAIVCEVPLSFVSMLLTGSNVKVDITNLTVTCIGPKPDNKVFFAMKNRILVGPPPECKKLQITDAGNGTYAAVDYTGTDGPPCGVTEAPASTSSTTTNANGQIAATSGAAQNELATALLLGLCSLAVAKW